MKHHQMAPSKKYFVSKPPKKNTKVLLLLKDDAKPYLTKQARTDLLADVSKQYLKAKEEARIESIPEITIAQASAQQQEGKMTMDDIIRGIKEGWITV